MPASISRQMVPSRWNRTTAAHLLRRAGFGGSAHLIDRLADMTPQNAVAYVIGQTMPEEDTRLPPMPEWITTADELAQLRSQAMQLSQEERRDFFQTQRRKEQQAVAKLKIWWLQQMLESPHMLREKMALFWHGHFATSAQKVQSSWANWHLYDVFRQQGLGDFRVLLRQVSRSPAMLQYLDNMRNRKGHPNENFARELMELFTLGIGHYTENDIKEAARALTGWTTDGAQFVYRRWWHDNDTKTVFGHTGNFNGDDILHFVCEHHAMPAFICRKIWEFFVYENPSDRMIRRLGRMWKARNYNLTELMREIFLSLEFYSERAMFRQIKSPVQLVVGLCRDLHLSPDRLPQRLTQLAMRSMGQDLFYPPNVKGWPGNRAWINTNTLLTRYNLPVAILLGDKPGLTDRSATQQQLARVLRRMAVRYRTDTPSARQWAYMLDDYFTSGQLDDDQKQLLQNVIAPQSRNTNQAGPESYLAGVVAALHLTVSSCEYQLC